MLDLRPGSCSTVSGLLRRSTDADSFNGTVIVERFNVSLSQDVDFVFAATHDYLLSNGYAGVGVSAQSAGTNPETG
jgi:Alpha/beta hydrolase domain